MHFVNSASDRRSILVDAEFVDTRGKLVLYEVGLAPDGKEKTVVAFPETWVCDAQGKVFVPDWLIRKIQKRLGKIFHVESVGPARPALSGGVVKAI